MSSARPIGRHRRGLKWMPLDFSAGTPSPKHWRWLAAACLFVSVAPLALSLPLGWLFALRVGFICILGAYKPQGLAPRLTLAASDFIMLLWWMFGGYPQAPTELALAVFILGVSFKAMELRTVGDGYMASAMCFMGPFIALIQHLPVWVVVPSSLSLLMALVLRSGMSCIESNVDPGQPWARRHWSVIVGMLMMVLPVALALFWILPRLPSPYLGWSQSPQTGISDTMEPGSMDRLMQNPAQAFLVNFNGNTPDPSQIYWRAFVLSSFNGRTWFQVGMPPDTEAAPVVSEDTPVFSYSMVMSPIVGAHVPLMDRPISVNGSRVLETSTMTYRSTDNDPNTIRQFKAVSAPSATLDIGVLSPVVRRATLMIPDGFNPRTRTMMEQWKAQGYEGEALVAKTLDYFKTNMTYSYTPPLLGRHSVDELMFDTREGFCEHFSSSFVFAMRAAGIPSRVVSGYQGGRRTSSGLWEVRQLDAHAWAEVWLQDKGWVRVDPTFSVVKKRPPPPGETKKSGVELDLPWMSWVHSKTTNWFGGFDREKQQDLFSRWKNDGWGKWFIALGVGIVVMAWALSAVLLGWRSRRDPREVIQWEKFRAAASKLSGLGYSSTARQLAKSLESFVSPDFHADILGVVNRWEAWRYAGQEDPSLARDLARIRRQLRFSRHPE